MPDVTLIPLTERERDAFVEEEIADYAEQKVRDAGWPRDGARERARAELTPVLNREFAEGAEQGHQLWSAMNSAGTCVGWLWVTPVDGASPRSAFLEQITVAASTSPGHRERASWREPVFGNVPQRALLRAHWFIFWGIGLPPGIVRPGIALGAVNRSTPSARRIAAVP